MTRPGRGPRNRTVNFVDIEGGATHWNRLDQHAPVHLSLTGDFVIIRLEASKTAFM